MKQWNEKEEGIVSILKQKCGKKINASPFLLNLQSSGESITVTSYFWEEGAGGYALDAIEFADGTSWNIAAVLEMPLNGSEGDDTVYGDSGDDVINGNGGNDALVRLAGRDTLRGLGRAKFCEERIAA